MRFYVLLTFILIITGCWKEQPVPKLSPISKISAKVYSVPELQLSPIDCVDIPNDQIKLFSALVIPSRKCEQQIKKEMHYHVADIYIQHEGVAKTTLLVRWTGQNPAAITLDDKNYYYGGTDDYADTTVRILRLLDNYNYEASKNKHN